MNNKILVIGDLILDIYSKGEITRISPEFPVPVLSKESDFYALGGAGNVAANLEALGATYEFIAVIGEDRYRSIIEHLLENINLYAVLSGGKMTNTTKNRFVAGSQHVLRVDKDNTQSYSDSEYLYNTIIDRLDSNEFEYLLICDYNKGLLSYNLIKKICEKCKELDVKVLADTKRKDTWCFNGAYLVTPNDKEFSGQLFQVFENILVTRGDKGMVLYAQDEGKEVISPYKVNCVDVCGAGDTVLAAIATSLQDGQSLYSACRVANLAASLVVQKPGTVVCSEEDLVDTRGLQKVYGSLDEVLKQIEIWRKEGYPIAFTNGCFDILHQGHLDLLHMCGKLNYNGKICKAIVAVDSNESVSKLKGSDRPFHKNRLETVANVQTVDLVFEFNTEDLNSILKTIKPNVLVKGPDYKDKEIIGREHANYVLVVPKKVTEISTTEILNDKV